LSDTTIMKKTLFPLPFALIAALFVGYYETQWAEDNRLIFFIKQSPTFQFAFVNIFDSDADDRPLDKLTDEQRKYVIDYCKYRLGIETTLTTQAELEVCKGR
jgi:hypothetical protein